MGKKTVEEQFDILIETLRSQFKENRGKAVHDLTLHLEGKWQKLIIEKVKADRMKIRLCKKLKVLPKKEAINLIEFFNDNRRDIPMNFEDEFLQVISEATTDNFYAPNEPDEFYVYDPQDAPNIAPDQITDLSTREGRLEGRKRLGAYAYCLSTQDEELSVSNGLGWFKLNDGKVVFPCIINRFEEKDPHWLCDAELHDDKSGSYHSYFISRNGNLAK